MPTPALIEDARLLLDQFRKRGWRLVTAESATGGLIVATLTEVPGASDVVERGFVTYSNVAKSELLGVPAAMIDAEGAVSRTVACAMAEGAAHASRADIAIAVTGIAGPDGGTAAKPVGLVHIAVHRRGGQTLHEECRLGDIGRHEVRAATVARAFTLVRRLLQSGTGQAGASPEP